MDGELGVKRCRLLPLEWITMRSCCVGPHMQHMEVPRLGVKSELQLLAYTTATATLDPSRICDLCWSLRATPDP